MLNSHAFYLFLSIHIKTIPTFAVAMLKEILMDKGTLATNRLL